MLTVESRPICESTPAKMDAGKKKLSPPSLSVTEGRRTARGERGT